MRKLSISLYYWGLSIGIMFLAVLLWGSIESSVFFEIDHSNTGLTGLWCPYFMHPDEVLEIQAPIIDNPTDKVMHSISYVEITTKVSSLLRTEKIVVDVPPNTHATANWTISETDKVFGSIILMRVIQYNDIGEPAYHAFCSVIVINVLELSGRTLLILSISLTFVFLAMAVLFPYFSFGRAKGRLTPDNIIFRQMLISVMGVVVGILLTLWTYWVPAFFIMILMMFLAQAIFKEIVLQEKNDRLLVELAD